jgi:eukaryotic-like serine/threonine-protein kinase
MLGRYALHQEIASGGMATVYFGRLLGPAGFSRTVAIKRLHPQFAKDPEFVAMFLDEARLAARVKHPNVVSILDVVAREGELFLVMEYMRGESLSRLQRLASEAGTKIPLPIVSAILVGLLCGLHAAHEACDEQGHHLDLVHRDVSPQNVLVGADGVPRLLDFGIAKAVGRLQTTREGQFKGKLAYMAPEQIHRGPVDRRTDVYAAAVVLYAALTGSLPYQGTEASLVYQILHARPEAPSALEPSVPAELDALVLRGMSPSPADRFATAYEMALALEHIAAPATQLQVGAWVQEIAHTTLERRTAQLREVEGTPTGPAELAAGLAASSAAPSPEPEARPSGVDAPVEPTTAITSVVPPAPRKPFGVGWVALGVAAGLAVGGLVAIQGSGGGGEKNPSAAALPAPPLTAPPDATIAAPTIAAPATSAPAAAEPPSSAHPSSAASASTAKKGAAAGKSRPKQPDYGF